MAQTRPFAELAAPPDARLDELALAMAAEFRTVDAAQALATLDALGTELAAAAAGAAGDQDAEARACAEVLGARHGFAGDREQYDDPANSMLDLVLRRRRGLPILLSVVYAEVARRAGVAPVGGRPRRRRAGGRGAPRPLRRGPLRGPAAAAARPVRRRRAHRAGRAAG